MPPILVAAIFLAVAISSHAGREIDSISGVRTMPPSEADKRMPATLEGTVTFYNRIKSNCFIHDGKEGMFVNLIDDPKTRPDISVGTRVRIKGVTQAGDFLPTIDCHELTVLGDGALPEPMPLDDSELFLPSLDCQWVEIQAIIVGNSNRTTENITLVAEVSGWTFMLHFPDGWDESKEAAELMQRPVRIRGVAGSLCNDERQLTFRYLFISSLDQISPVAETRPNEDPPLLAVNELLRSDSRSNSSIRVRGTITHAASDGLYLRGDQGSLLIRTAITQGYKPGMQIEAEGFAALAMFRPNLRASRVTVLSQGAPPAALPLDLTGERLIRQQAELVTLDADLLTLKEGTDDEVILQCRAREWFFEARLKERDAIRERLQPNDRLRLTGICELINSQPLAANRHADGFRIQLRDASDITILKPAPWWTFQRLLWALAGVVSLAIASLAWVAALRRHVDAQTVIISKQIKETAIRDERQRVARELHDTIEQELAGLSIQLSNARQRLSQAPQQADQALNLAQRMLRHCREEARTSIRDLRSVTLDRHGLAGALREFLEPLASECHARFTFNEHGRIHEPAGNVAIHLLRLAQEAVLNAARHAQPSEIIINLTQSESTLILEIRDDGCGFDPAIPAPRGHFGVLGIRERANKLHAHLSIESEPGCGTMVRVIVPTHPPQAGVHLS